MMLTEKVANRILATLAVGALLIGALGFWQVSSKQDRVLAAMDVAPRSAQTLSVDYTGAEGEPHHVIATSDPGETPTHLAARLKDLLDASEVEFPRRK